MPASRNTARSVPSGIARVCRGNVTFRPLFVCRHNS